MGERPTAAGSASITDAGYNWWLVEMRSRPTLLDRWGFQTLPTARPRARTGGLPAALAPEGCWTKGISKARGQPPTALWQGLLLLPPDGQVLPLCAPTAISSPVCKPTPLTLLSTRSPTSFPCPVGQRPERKAAGRQDPATVWTGPTGHHGNKPPQTQRKGFSANRQATKWPARMLSSPAAHEIEI